MSKEDSLFSLIKSLSQTEKRYFKVNSQVQGKQNNYMLLFEAIDKMDDYDEAVLLKKFKGTTFIKHLPSEKNYLYDLILKTMRSYHASRTVSHELHNLLQEILFLLDKGLYDACLKKIKKAKKLAYDFDKYSELLEVIHWQRKLLRFLKLPNLLEETLELATERKRVMEIFNNEFELVGLYERVLVLSKSKLFKQDTESREELLLIEKSEILTSVEKAISFKAKTFFYLCRSYISLLNGDQIACKENNEKAIALWESRPDRINEEPDRFKALLSNYLSDSFAHHTDESFKRIVAKFRKLESSSPKEEALDFIQILKIELLYYMNKPDLGSARNSIKYFEANLEKLESAIEKASLISIYFNISSIYFLSEDFDSCKVWIEKIIDQKSDVQPNIQHFARIMQLIINFETTPLVADYFYGMTYRYLYKYAQQSAFEKAILKYVKKFIALGNTDKAKLNQLLEALKQELEELSAQKDRSIGLEELICWVEAKLNKTTIEEVLKVRLDKYRKSISKN